MGEWQPIKTAPKDGTPILGYFGLTAGDEPPDMAVTRYKRSWGWMSTEVPFARFGNPTFWMPLPDPPKESQS
jgi:hypothetical protein